MAAIRLEETRHEDSSQPAGSGDGVRAELVRRREQAASYWLRTKEYAEWGMYINPAREIRRARRTLWLADLALDLFTFNGRW